MALTPDQIVALKSVPLGSMANKVRLARTMLGAKQIDFAEAVGLRPPNLSDIERGEYKDLPLETTRRISDYLGVAIGDLFPSREAVTS